MRQRERILAWGDFHVRSRFAHPTIPEEKWGTIHSLLPNVPKSKFRPNYQISFFDILKNK